MSTPGEKHPDLNHLSKHAPFAAFGAIVGSLKMPKVLVQSHFERDKLTQIVENLAQKGDDEAQSCGEDALLC